MKKHATILMVLFIVTLAHPLATLSFSEQTQTRLWRWAEKHYSEMLNYCFPLKPVLHYGSDYISFRYYESLFGLNVEEYSFVLYSYNNGTACKAIYRSTKGGGLCRQIAEQIERGHSGETSEMIKRIRIEEHTVNSKQCPKLCEFHASLKKLCLPLRYQEALLDPPTYNFLFENPEVRYSSPNPNEEIVRIALAAYQEMKKCEGKKSRNST